jgi:hypothetical protein
VTQLLPTQQNQQWLTRDSWQWTLEAKRSKSSSKNSSSRSYCFSSASTWDLTGSTFLLPWGSLAQVAAV